MNFVTHISRAMDGEILKVVILSLLPGLSNFVGGLFAERLRPSEVTLNRALHAATGIIISVVAVQVMPQALRSAPSWLLAVAFLAGGGAYLAVQAGIEGWQRRKQGGSGAGAWMVYIAVAADLVGDGFLIGAGSSVSSRMALVLTLGLVLADMPEGFSVIGNFRNKGLGRAKRILISASFVVPVIGTALIGYFVLAPVL